MTSCGRSSTASPTVCWVAIARNGWPMPTFALRKSGDVEAMLALTTP